MVDRPILLIDALNNFTRHFAANPTISSLGDNMGGVVGTMRAIKNVVDEQRPKQVVLVWEGGGSKRRRQLFSEYKMNRKPERLNRFYGDDIPNTVENRDDQIKALISCLKHTPICQVYVADCEADDVIAYLCRTRMKDEQVTIMSSDSDFYQLLDGSTRIFRPGKKIFVTKEDVVREFGISPRNFHLAKALCGDVADNIPGIKGVGFKTLAKRFTQLSSDVEFELEQLIRECESMRQTSKVKLYGNILENQDIIKRNMRLVTLDGSMLAPQQTKKIDFVLDTYEPKRDKIEFIRELIRLGLNEFQADEFFYVMGIIGE